VAVAALHAGRAAIRRTEPGPAASGRSLLLVTLGLWAASALTPDPAGALGMPFRFLDNLARDPLHGAIEELRPWSWTLDRAEPFTALLALALVAAALGGLAAWRAAPAPTLAATGAVLAALLALRSRALAAYLMVPPIALALDAPGWRRRAGLVLAMASALAGVSWLIWAPGFTPGVTPQERSVPARAVALADSLDLDGAPLNTFHYGGYLLWARGDLHPPLVDGRALGSRAFRTRLLRAFADSAALDSVLAEWRCTHAVLAPPVDPSDHLAGLLLRRSDWTLIFADDAGLLLVRRDRFPEIAATLGYRLLNPDYEAMALLAQRALADSALRRSLAADLQRARAASPWHARASLWLGLLALGGGDATRAVALLEEAERLAPATPGLALRLGWAREQAGDAAGAAAAFRRALREPADTGAARAALARVTSGPGGPR
jgi:tetratricopeptide (TPR) repeat protein